MTSPENAQPPKEELVPYYCRDCYDNHISVMPKNLKNHLSREPIYRDDVLFKYLWLVLSEPDDILFTQVDRTKRTKKSGVVFEYHRSGLMEKLGLEVPEGFYDEIIVQVLFPHSYSHSAKDPDNIDGFTLTYYLRDSYYMKGEAT